MENYSILVGEESPKHICESEITEAEYCRMLHFFPSFYWKNVERVTLRVIIILLLCAFWNQVTLEEFFYSFAVIELIIVVVYKILHQKMGKNAYRFLCKKD